MPSVPDRLKDYVEVKDRIRLFYEAYPNGRLVTNRAEYWLEIEPPRVVVQAFAYRTPDDPFPGTGWSWMLLPGSTPYTRGSELENTETSAWGRAIGALGLGIDRSIASVNEIESKAGDPKASGLVDGDIDQPRADGGLIGKVSRGQSADTDLAIRQDRDKGPYVGFVLAQGRSRLKVVAVGPLADALVAFLPGLVGQRVTCYGRIEMVPYKRGDQWGEYKRLQLERIVTEDFTLPAKVEAEPIPMEL